MPGARTIGDLVNGEIERTLEISNQSIINATVNMSARYHEPPHQPPHQPLEGKRRRPGALSHISVFH